jgi:hypothetical protein
MCIKIIDTTEYRTICLHTKNNDCLFKAKVFTFNNRIILRCSINKFYYSTHLLENSGNIEYIEKFIQEYDRFQKINWNSELEKWYNGMPKFGMKLCQEYDFILNKIRSIFNNISNEIDLVMVEYL